MHAGSPQGPLHSSELQDTHQNASEEEISWMFHKWKMAIAPPRSHHAQQRDTATSNVQMDLGKNAEIGSSGLCGAAPPMERDVDYPAGPVDPRTAFLLGM